MDFIFNDEIIHGEGISTKECCAGSEYVTKGQENEEGV
jgi:hypothetical protein